MAGIVGLRRDPVAQNPNNLVGGGSKHSWTFLASVPRAYCHTRYRLGSAFGVVLYSTTIFKAQPSSVGLFYFRLCPGRACSEGVLRVLPVSDSRPQKCQVGFSVGLFSLKSIANFFELAHGDPQFRQHVGRVFDQWCSLDSLQQQTFPSQLFGALHPVNPFALLGTHECFVGGMRAICFRVF